MRSIVKRCGERFRLRQSVLSEEPCLCDGDRSDHWLLWSVLNGPQYMRSWVRRSGGSIRVFASVSRSLLRRWHDEEALPIDMSPRHEISRNSV